MKTVSSRQRSRRLLVATLAWLAVQCGPRPASGPVREFVPVVEAPAVFPTWFDATGGAGAADGNRFFTASRLLGVDAWSPDAQGTLQRTPLGPVTGNPVDLRVAGGRLMVMSTDGPSFERSTLTTFGLDGAPPVVPSTTTWSASLHAWDTDGVRLNIVTLPQPATLPRFQRYQWNAQGELELVMEWALPSSVFPRWVKGDLLAAEGQAGLAIMVLDDSRTGFVADAVLGPSEYAGNLTVVETARTDPRDIDSTVRITVRQFEPGGSSTVLRERVVGGRSRLGVARGAILMPSADGGTELLDVRAAGAPRVVGDATGMTLLGVLGGTTAIVADSSRQVRAWPLDQGAPGDAVGTAGELLDAHPSGSSALVVGVDDGRFLAVVMRGDGSVNSRTIGRFSYAPAVGPDHTLWVGRVEVAKDTEGGRETLAIAPEKYMFQAGAWGRAWVERGAQQRARLVVDRGAGPREVNTYPPEELVDVRMMPAGLVVVTVTNGESTVTLFIPAADGATLEDAHRVLTLPHSWPSYVTTADDRLVLLGAFDDGEIPSCPACADCYFYVHGAIRLLDFRGTGTPAVTSRKQEEGMMDAIVPGEMWVFGDRLFIPGYRGTAEYDLADLGRGRVGLRATYSAVSPDGHALTPAADVVRIGAPGADDELRWKVPTTAGFVFVDGDHAFTAGPGVTAQRHQHAGDGNVNTQEVAAGARVTPLDFDHVLARTLERVQLLRLAADATGTVAWEADASVDVQAAVTQEGTWLATVNEVVLIPR